MNKTVKKIGKKVIYPMLIWLDNFLPAFSAFLVRRFYRFRALNDLQISKQYHYDPFGVYVTLRPKIPSFYLRFLATYTRDTNGLPQYTYEGKSDYQVVQLAQFGLMEYGYYLDNHDESHRKNCLACADKLVELQDTLGGWPCFFDYPCPEVNSLLKAGWYTAMGQGQAISLFVRANTLEPKEVYQSAAHRALNILEIPVKDGGVLAKLGNLDFYEEYPTDTPSYTLNGLMFCMIGLYDGARAFHDEWADTLFHKMLHTLKLILPLYDDETITSYDLSHITNPPKMKLRSRKYHILHIKLLQAIDDIAHDDIFTFYVNKWRKR